MPKGIHDLERREYWVIGETESRKTFLAGQERSQLLKKNFTLSFLVLARAGALLGIVALLHASVGLYRVTSYSVTMRGREIAVRMALGARTDRVVAMVLRQALAVAMIGFVLGGLAAIGAGLAIQAEVFGVAGVDVATLAGSAALPLVAMLLASILPVRRAARLDPNVVLRGE